MKNSELEKRTLSFDCQKQYITTVDTNYVDLFLLNVIFIHQAKFMEGVKEVCTSQFLSAVAELCHMDTNLAEWVWLQFFPRIWKILSEKQQQVSSLSCSQDPV